jgi:hypothetical protein
VRLRWVGNRKGRKRGFYEIWMDIFRLITIFKSKVLKERIGGQWRGEERRREEKGWIREDRGLSFREEKWKIWWPVVRMLRHGWSLRRRRRVWRWRWRWTWSRRFIRHSLARFSEGLAY